ncbi:MAG: (2Fe-2S)-binding protein [Candidatus Izemoplasmatales bacterium]|jgi:NAD(P)H-nitrite reductase large subunit|nr:(2Fe-2S)-binding protein [Candidatus Izemoplasmatales bacterium]
MNDKLTIICRCEDITKEQIHECLEKGFTNYEDLKRQLRVGMGPCQGQTCSELIQREIAIFLGKKYEEISIQKTRPLITGVKLKSINEGTKDES